MGSREGGVRHLDQKDKKGSGAPLWRFPYGVKLLELTVLLTDLYKVRYEIRKMIPGINWRVLG
jgi:hypothetical protein